MALPDLNQQPISEIYKGLLHTSNNALINEYDLLQIYDGDGNRSAMKLGRENNKNAVEFSNSLIAKDFVIKEFENLINFIYPIGAIFLSFNERNPQDRFIGTEWIMVSEGRFLVGVGNNTDTSLNNVTYQSGNNKGSNRIELTIDNLPSHSHKSLNFVVNPPTYFYNSIITPVPYVTLQYQNYPTEINEMFSKSNSIINQFSFFKIAATPIQVVSTAVSNAVDLYFRGLYNTKTTFKISPLSFSGVSLIANTGQGIAFDKKLPSYGVYMWRRTK